MKIKLDEGVFLEVSDEKIKEMILGAFNKSTQAVVEAPAPRKAGYKKPKGSRVWTEDEQNKLKTIWDHISTRQIAREFDRTPTAIRVRASRLGLKR